jgi:chromosome segregation ATPase
MPAKHPTKTKSDQIAELQSLLETAQAAMEAIREKREEYASQVRALASDLLASKNAAANLLAELQEVKAKRTFAEKCLAEVRADRDEAQSELYDRREQLSEARGRECELQAEVNAVSTLFAVLGIPELRDHPGLSGRLTAWLVNRAH